jgi:hypothetical protein
MMDVSFQLRYSIDMARKVLPRIADIFDSYSFFCRRGGECRRWSGGRAWCLVVGKKGGENKIQKLGKVIS